MQVAPTYIYISTTSSSAAFVLTRLTKVHMEPDYESAFWADDDEEFDTSSKHGDCPEDFIWQCCMRKASELGYINETSGSKTTKRVDLIWEARMVFRELGRRAGSTMETFPRSRSTIYLEVPVKSITRSRSTISLEMHEALTLHEAASVMNTERINLEGLYDFC
jgi:hypothetical protein